MSIKLNINKNLISEDKFAKIHLVPFRIDHDGPANVEKYFTPYLKTSDKSKVSALDASFRGFPLKGQSIPLPEGYKGLVFTEKSQSHVEGEARDFFLKTSFNKITYWNYDKIPSKNDAVISAMDWIDVAKAIHSESEDEGENQENEG